MPKSLLIFVILFMAMNSAHACKVRMLTTNERANESKTIYLGRITAIHIPALEKKAAKDYGLGRVNRVVQVYVHNTLVGTPTATIESEVHWCGGNAWGAELGKHVAVFIGNLGNWYIENRPEEISVLKKLYEQE